MADDRNKSRISAATLIALCSELIWADPKQLRVQQDAATRTAAPPITVFDRDGNVMAPPVEGESVEFHVLDAEGREVVLLPAEPGELGVLGFGVAPLPLVTACIDVQQDRIEMTVARHPQPGE